MNVSEFCIYFKKSVSSSHGSAAERKSSPRDYFYSYTKALFMVFILRMRSMEWLGNKNATCLMMKMLGVQKKKRWLGCNYMSMCKLAWVCAALAPSWLRISTKVVWKFLARHRRWSTMICDVQDTIPFLHIFSKDWKDIPSFAVSICATGIQIIRQYNDPSGKSIISPSLCLPSKICNIVTIVLEIGISFEYGCERFHDGIF